MGDALLRAMMSKKALRKVWKQRTAAMPAIPYITKRRSGMVLSLVLGGIGVALMGGMAAVMILSPRTRYRALDMAKNTYDKVGSQIMHLRRQRLAETALSNGV